MANKKNNCTFNLLIIYSICLAFSSCQNNIFPVETPRDSIDSSKKNYNSVFDLEKNPFIRNHLNADISLNDSTIRLSPEDSLYGIICSCLGLNNPIITIFGFQDVANIRLIKIKAEDVMHDNLYVMLFDGKSRFMDSLSSLEPINGDQLGYEDGASVEWHYYSNYYYLNDLVCEVVLDCDVMIHGNEADTLFCKKNRTYYMIVNNQLQVYAKDSVTYGEKY